jgi:hypothetical protein
MNECSRPGFCLTLPFSSWRCHRETACAYPSDLAFILSAVRAAIFELKIRGSSFFSYREARTDGKLFFEL